MLVTRYVITAKDTLFSNWPIYFRYLLPAKHFNVQDHSYSAPKVYSQGNYNYFPSPLTYVLSDKWRAPTNYFV
jgi:hypothetical protein